MNNNSYTPAQHEGSTLGDGETPALRDAISGLTGNLGIEAYAWQLDARQAIQFAEYHAASAAREQEEAAALAAAQGEG